MSPFATIDYLLKFACTDVSLVIVTSQDVAVLPAQAPAPLPLQLAKVLPFGGIAVSVTIVPCVNFAEQLPPQFN